jgi:N-acetylmuramoyl-L-alanine amidase
VIPIAFELARLFRSGVSTGQDPDGNPVSEGAAQNVVLSLTEYFGIPFVPAQPAYRGEVDVQSGWLNIRSRPSTLSRVIARAWDGNPITVLGEWQGWYVVNYYGNVGYADSRYIKLIER